MVPSRSLLLARPLVHKHHGPTFRRQARERVTIQRGFFFAFILMLHGEQTLLQPRLTTKEMLHCCGDSIFILAANLNRFAGTTLT